jgi:hypothetical protein
MHDRQPGAYCPFPDRFAAFPVPTGNGPAAFPPSHVPVGTYPAGNELSN